MTRFPFADRVRAVLFDAGNTLLCVDNARVAEILCGIGVQCDEPRVSGAEMRARPRLDPFLASAPRRESREVFQRFVEILMDELGEARPATCTAAAAAIQAAWPTLWARVPADAHSTLAALRARGYRVGCVSNANGMVRTALDAARLLQHLECVVDSGIEGIEKPDPRIFHRAAVLLDVAPETCVYVGDLHAVDVVGARNARMEPVLVDPDGVWPHVDVPKIAALSDLLRRL